MVEIGFQKIIGASKKEIEGHYSKWNQCSFGNIFIYKPEQGSYQDGCPAINKKQDQGIVYQDGIIILHQAM